MIDRLKPETDALKARQRAAMAGQLEEEAASLARLAAAAYTEAEGAMIGDGDEGDDPKYEDGAKYLKVVAAFTANVWHVAPPLRLHPLPAARASASPPRRRRPTPDLLPLTLDSLPSPHSLALNSPPLPPPPHPRTRREVKVKAGDRVAKGDTLLILEAMKMESVRFVCCVVYVFCFLGGAAGEGEGQRGRRHQLFAEGFVSFLG